MPSFTVRVIEDTVTPVLAKLPDMVKAETTKAILDVGQNEMVPDADQLCPKRTGYLASTIFFRMTAEMNFEFGADAYYALYVEMGTWKMAARHFIMPAFEMHLADINDSIAQGIMRAIQR